MKAFFVLFFFCFFFIEGKLWLKRDFFDKMWEKYVTSGFIPNPKPDSNYCAARLSYSFNEAVDALGKNHRISYTHPYTVRDSKNRWIFLGVQRLKEYFARTYGHPEIKHFTKEQIKGVKGIIAFGGYRYMCPGFETATGHFDLWDGTDCKGSCAFDSCTYQGKPQVVLWPVNEPGQCFDKKGISYYYCKPSSECSNTVPRRRVSRPGCSEGVCCLDNPVPKAEPEPEPENNTPEPTGPVGVDGPGVVKVKIIKGVDLQFSEFWSTIDPYVKVYNGDDYISTNHIDNTINPVWNKQGELSIPNVHRKLRVELWEHNDIFAHEKLGTSELDLDDLPEYRPVQKEIGAKDNDISHGTLYFELSFAPDRTAFP